MVTRESWFSVWFDRFLSCLGGTKSAPAISGNNLNSRMPSMSDDFWSTSTCDLDEMLTLQSRQNSFISSTNHSSNHGGGTDNLSNHSDFVNHGFILWNQSRLRWVGNCVPAKRTKKNHLTGLSWKIWIIKNQAEGFLRSTHAFWKVKFPVDFGWYMTKELLLESKRPYHRRIPLSEMIDFLVEEWEEEGLYY